VEIATTEDGLTQVRVAPLTARQGPRAALRRLLANSGYRAVPIGANAYRIVRARTPRRAPAPAANGALPAGDIVVTASKQRVSLRRYPGSITAIGGGTGTAARPAADLDALAQSTPILQTTALGPGRNKVFIRGIADSSFNGATQSTASIYFGEVQLSYSGPEPALTLVDMQSVEVMEGPQGTLYGAGAIGGVIRLTPNPVALDRVGAAIAGGVSLTSQGRPGHDLDGHVNLPIVGGVAGIRLTGYQSREGGFVDDAQRGLRDVNAVDRVGGRAALLIDPDSGWTIDASVLGQHIVGRDGGYALQGEPALTRRSRLDQPFANSIVLGRLVVTHQWGDGMQLVSATGIADSRSTDRFDASRRGYAVPIAYRNHEENQLLTQETRLSRSGANGASWVVGVALLRDQNAQDRSVGPVGNPTDIIGVTNLSRSVSVFGEITVPASASLSATVGVRGTRGRIDGDPSFRVRGGEFLAGREVTRADPTLALSYAVTPQLSAYARIQSGYRTGGLAVARGVGRVAQYDADAIRMGELGLRLMRRGTRGLSASAALSYAGWNDIQGDLVDRRGLPYTANIGDARILTLETHGDWRSGGGLAVDFAALYTRNRVTGSLASSSPLGNRRLPDTPAFSGHLGVRHERPIGRDRLRVETGVDYIGRSVLGVGDYLDIDQGRYATLGGQVGWQHHRLDLTLAVENATDTRGNRFALGNPFALVDRNQITPLRPVTVRVGAAIAW